MKLSGGDWERLLLGACGSEPEAFCWWGGFIGKGKQMKLFAVSVGERWMEILFLHFSA